MSIVVRTLSERVFEIVRDQIVTGRLVANAPIRQDALAAELGVSKIPLREALARLEQEGLIRSQANRGYVVRPMSADQADEIFALRLAIEPGAAAFACTRADDAGRARVRAAFERLDHAACGDLTEVAISNRGFHTAMVSDGSRSLTAQLVERLAILAERYVVTHLEPAGRDARAHLEHLDLVDAWCAGDAPRLQRLLHDHLASARDDLRAHFSIAVPA